MPALAEIENLIETGRHDEAATRPGSASNRHCRRRWRGRSWQAHAATDDRRVSLRAATSSSTRSTCRGAPPCSCQTRRSTCGLKARYGRPSLPIKGSGPSSICRAFGFAWVAKEADLARPPASSGGLSARGRQLKNESIEIEIDAATGGLRSVAGVGEPTARFGQQLVMTGLFDAQGKPASSQMRSERFDIDYGGPALVQATATGIAGPPPERNPPGLVRAALPALDGPADPRDRGHAGRS